MADEARSLKAYGELPENSKDLVDHLGCQSAFFFRIHLLTTKDVLSSSLKALSSSGWQGILIFYLCGAVRVNETDTFADNDDQNDEYFDFEDISGMWLKFATRHPCAQAWFPLAQVAPSSLHILTCCGFARLQKSKNGAILLGDFCSIRRGTYECVRQQSGLSFCPRDLGDSCLQLLVAGMGRLKCKFSRCM